MAKNLISPLAFLSAAALFTGSLQAQHTTYSDQQDFEDGLLPSFYTETFEDYDPALTQAGGDNDFEQYSALYDDSATFSFVATSASADGTESPAPFNDDFTPIWYATGDGYDGTALSVLDLDTRLRFTDFGGGVDSFGGQFFLTADNDSPNADVSAGTLDVIVTFSDSSTHIETLTSPAPGGELEFFGIIAEQGLAITQVDIVSHSSSFLPTAGSITVGTQIPEPATVVFWSGLGVFALVVAWRRRKQAA